VNINNQVLSEFPPDRLERAQTEFIQVPTEGIAVSDYNWQLETLNSRLDALINTPQTTSQEDRNYNVNRYYVIAGVIGSVISGLATVAFGIYTVLWNSLHSNNNNSADASIRIEADPSFGQLDAGIAAWSAQTDVQYWNNIAS
jgi:uncharacterized membrane protein